MIKEFFKNSMIYLIGNFFIKGYQILILPVYTRFLSSYEFGIIDIFMVFFSLVNIVITLEISQSIAKYYGESKSPKDKRVIVSTGFLFTVIVYLFFLFICLVFGDKLSSFLINKKSNRIFYLAIISVVTNGIFYYTNNILKWRIEPKKLIYTSLANIFFISFISILLLYTTDLRIESIFIGQIIGNFLSIILSIFFAREDYGLTFKLTKLREMVYFSISLVLSSLTFVLLFSIDRIFIKYFLNLNELGIYGIANRFAQISTILIYVIQNSLMPLIYKNYQKEDTPSEISKIFNIFNFLVFSIISFMILFSKELVILITTESFYESYTLIPILTLASFMFNMYLFAPGIWLKGKTKYFAIITFIILLTNILLNYFLIKFFSTFGVSIATLLSSILFFLLNVIVSQKYYFIPYKFKRITIVAIISIFVCYIATFFINGKQTAMILKSLLFLLLEFFLIKCLIGLKNFAKIYQNIKEIFINKLQTSIY